ncbi:YheC/YheD family protein [Paenibacillus psychroresistens]|uniref:YheC/YheD family protein n=1 Tax=Paenibacillus psychroresistens TaxID=1778678 RepID=A0A6B8RJ79_9BACL|nr:YheC/YheD family protein [Paenibacillus psychroresistens]QGQ96521.1 YheC/YheD family protein [Paenibacillus psychroresistens]
MPGKWGLHTFYSKDRKIRRLLPKTKVLSKASLRKLIKRYGSVYIKPNMEHMGKGIMKAVKTSKKYKLVRVNKGKHKFSNVQKLIRKVKKITRNKPYIIQKTIPLAHYRGRSYDIRVMMMRNKQDKWTYIGMLAKVMGPSSIISNIRRGGGYAITVGQALKKSVAPAARKRKKLKRKLIKTSYRICKRFNRYKYSSQIGIDYAVDKRGRLWLIEVNFDFPSHGLFARLPDKSIYRLIKRTRAKYLKAKGRR